MPEYSCWLVIRGTDIGLFSENLILKSLLKQNSFFYFFFFFLIQSYCAGAEPYSLSRNSPLGKIQGAKLA